MSEFWNNYIDIFNELNHVKSIMKESIKSNEKYFQESIHSMIDAKGKMLRPAFMMISGKFGDYKPKKMQNLAAVIELLHIATLVHDDIIDEEKLRRGVQTIQSKYGKEYAIYVGDFLFSHCFMMLAEYEYNSQNLKEISKAISKVCLGEIKQYNLRYFKEINLRNYIRIISGKTATLFALSFYVGAKESNCDEKLSRILGKIGYNIGMAFQIVDDILDYNSSIFEVGKGTQKDLIRGYYTLPLIFALESDKSNELSKYLANSSFNKRDLSKIVELVNKLDGTERARKVAMRYTDRAFQSIDNLPSCESKEILKDVTKKLLNRSY